MHCSVQQSVTVLCCVYMLEVVAEQQLFKKKKKTLRDYNHDRGCVQLKPQVSFEINDNTF